MFSPLNYFLFIVWFFLHDKIVLNWKAKWHFLMDCVFLALQISNRGLR